MQRSNRFEQYRRRRIITGGVTAFFFYECKLLYQSSTRPWWEIYNTAVAREGSPEWLRDKFVWQGRLQVATIVVFIAAVLNLYIFIASKRWYRSELEYQIATAPTRADVDEAEGYAQLAEGLFYQLEINDPRRVKAMEMSKYFHWLSGHRLTEYWAVENARQDLARLKKWLP